MNPFSRVLASLALGLSLNAPAGGPAHGQAGRLGVTPSARSLDYVNGKRQFQLHTLLTEQRHPRTFDLSQTIATDTQGGLAALLSVDEDIAATFAAIADDPARLAQLEQASAAMQAALRGGHRLYFYGTGSTGRLAATLESGLWRPFWIRVDRTPAGRRIAASLPGLGGRVRGEITGGDRALISSLEGFEDLQLIGALQLADNGVGPQDLVFAVTEGGETSAVIGTALAAAGQPGREAGSVWFVYNNPDQVLAPFERSRAVLENPAVRKIQLATGPQAITGSTRMQATTTSLYLLGVVLEDAVQHLLTPMLTPEELADLDISPDATIAGRLREFAAIQHAVAAGAARLAPWTDAEAAAYASGHHATYLAQRALMPVFVDVTERAPTFRLAPLDRIDAAQRRSWIQVLAPTGEPDQAWRALLHRPFHGLDPALYQSPFEAQIDDPYLRAAALRSLSLAGDEQQGLYDLALSPPNRERAPPQAGDVGALFVLEHEAMLDLHDDWLATYRKAGADLTVVSVASTSMTPASVRRLTADGARVIDVTIPQRDPFELNQTIALKMLLNAHSTGVMAKRGRVVGNTMTNVQPGNLKLVGRATYLIQLHVNAVLVSETWRRAHGPTPPLDYAEANAVLFEAIEQRADTPALARTAEVELAIVAILESLAKGRPISWSEATQILGRQGLNGYLAAAGEEQGAA